MVVATQEKQERVEPDDMLTTAAAMADALEYYLIEGNIFRIVMVRRKHGFERMTMSIGELLALVNILQAKRADMTSAQRVQLDDILATIAHSRQQLYEPFRDLIVREIMSRLDSINWFLHDCENGKESCRVTFPSEMCHRQRIEEMVKALGNEVSTGVAERIERIDQRLRRITHKGEFIWPTEVQAIYPEDRYWFLYSLPKLVPLQEPRKHWLHS